MNVDEIKARFPKPMTADMGKCRIYGYCVGGAFCMAWDERNGRNNTVTTFPPDTEIADAMQGANPELDTWLARHYAKMLTRANDRGDFDQAWWYLGQALAFTADNNLGI